MISVEEYRRLKRRDRQVHELEDFTDADIAALEESRAPESSKAFDGELKQGVAFPWRKRFLYFAACRSGCRINFCTRQFNSSAT
jgi:hypothetical protein